jgi:hypothetical protein
LLGLPIDEGARGQGQAVSRDWSILSDHARHMTLSRETVLTRELANRWLGDDSRHAAFGAKKNRGAAEPLPFDAAQ